jgi:DNA-binding protein YbaB
MVSEISRARVAGALETVRTQFENMARARRECAALTVTMSSPGDQVSVTVDGEGVVTGVRFGADVEEWDYDEIAALLTETAARAASTVAGKRAEIVAAVVRPGRDVPELSEVAPKLPDLAAVRETVSEWAAKQAGIQAPSRPAARGRGQVTETSW